jgi:valyl-tRNA synthetase
MFQNDYITVSEYAARKGISKQAVYKQLNNKLKDFLIVVDGKKYILLAAFGEPTETKLNNQVEQPSTKVEQPLNNQVEFLFEKQLAEKDTTIQSLLRQLESLQEQNHRLTELLQNSQVILAAEKKLYIEEEKGKEKEKKGFLGFFKKK